MSLQLRRRQRVLTSREFQQVFRRCRRVSDPYFMVCARFATQPAPRLGLAISKKQARRAVDRNRIKRHAREVFRHASSSLPPGDYIVVNRRDAASAPAKTLRQSLETLFAALRERKSPRRRRPDSA